LQSAGGNRPGCPWGLAAP